jgi:hypothetical protein
VHDSLPSHSSSSGDESRTTASRQHPSPPETPRSAGAGEVLITTKPAPKGTGFEQWIRSELLKEAHLGPRIQVSSGGSPGAPQAVQMECRQN